ncbi:MAG TPA: hypothetical protein VMV78_02460 [Thiobacillus sp.]|nr:hypothetical protein [Thiobacillus sp.]
MAINFRIEVDIDDDFRETTVEIDGRYVQAFGWADAANTPTRTIRARGINLSAALGNLARLLDSLSREEIELIGMKSRGLLRER